MPSPRPAPIRWEREKRPTRREARGGHACPASSARSRGARLFAFRSSVFGLLSDFGFRASDFSLHRALTALAFFACTLLSLPAQPAKPPLYENTFEQAEIGKLPEGFMSLNGEFAVKQVGTNKCLELPGAPLDTFTVLYGPAASADVAVSARIFGTARGRREPTFGVGLGGASGFRLRVSPGKKALELLKDEDVKASVPYTWKSGTWTLLRLQIRKVKDGAWRAEGKAWEQGSAEPADWSLTTDDQTEPVTGKASIMGCPFSGTPIDFDDLRVEAATAKP